MQTMRYDPEQAPEASAWLALDEQERFDLVEEYHRRARIRVPNRKMHAIVHAVIENQIAEGHEPVVRAMSRLTSGGLPRHEALHAIGSVLAENIFDVLHGTSGDGDPMVGYDAAVERLTADDWLRG